MSLFHEYLKIVYLSAGGLIIIASVVYLMSRIQMRGWLNEIERFLTNKFNNQNERQQEENE